MTPMKVMRSKTMMRASKWNSRWLNQITNPAQTTVRTCTQRKRNAQMTVTLLLVGKMS
jgi:hypothetical protein